MPAATSIVATVLSVSGTVYARAIDGSMRTVKPGDVLTEGELLVAPPGSSAELMAANGEILPVASGVELALTPEMTNEGLNAEQAASVDEDVNAVLEALADGRDLNEALEETAAGLLGGGQSDGHNFVILARTAEQLDRRFPLAFNDSNQSLPDQELVAGSTSEDLLLVTNPAVTVTSFLTADKTPAFSGTIDDPAANVTLIINGISYAAINNGDGSWTLADNTVPALNEGETSIEVRAENTAGLSTTSAGLVVIDTTAPLVTAADVATRDNTPELTGTVDDPSASIVVTINGVDYPAVNNGDGSWVLSDDSIAELDVGATIITVSATDPLGNISSSTATITINPDLPPEITVTAVPVTEESVTVDTLVANFVSSDPDNDELTHQLLNNDNGYFAIVANTVRLTQAGVDAINDDSLNLESIVIEVEVTAFGTSVIGSDTLLIERVNDAPIINSATGSNQLENTAVAGDTVATFVANDPEGDAITYSITSGNENNYFEIVDNTSGVVTLTAAGEAAIENDELNLANQVIGVTASDGSDNSREAMATIVITHVNDNPPVIDTTTGSTQVENTAVAGDTVATFVASDLDSDAITYSITSGNDDGYFAIDANTGVVTLTTDGQAAIENDALNLADQVIGVTANDGTFDSAEATATIVITRVNDNPPVIDTATGSTQIENTAVAGDTVATFVASDLDGDAITYSITSGNDDGYFSIDANTGVVTLTAAGQVAIENDVLDLTNQVIGVTANDGMEDSAEVTATIEIILVNDNPPVIDTATGSTQVENTAVAGDTVATFIASDLDGDAITYNISSGNANGYFAIDANTGVVTLTAAGQTAIENDPLNLADQVIGVTANDGTFDSAEATATIEVIHVNDNPPVIDTATGSTQIENFATVGDTVATFVASDLDGDAITYSISSGNDDGYFVMDTNSGVVTLTAVGQAAIENDSLTLASQVIGVTANDGAFNSAEAFATIDITQVSDNRPVIDTATGSTQIENTAVAGDTVATFVASDMDGDAITYSITSGNEANYFAIDANTGVVTLTVDGQAAIENDVLNLSDQVIGVTANDGIYDSVEATATIVITLVNDNAPVIDTATGSAQLENIAIAGDTVANFVASDLDGDAVTYSITSGNGNAYFEILDSTSGVVTLTAAGATALANAALTDTDYILGVTATDGTLDSAEATVTISFDGINDVPTIDTATGSTQVENIAVAGDTVATFVASDLDGDAVTYSITSGNDNAYFEILDSASGEVTLTAAGATALANDALTDADYLLGVTANDGTVDSAEATVTISFDGINDAPTIDTATGSTQVENIAVAGDTVATFVASDLDGDAVTYSITSGNGNAYFEILDPASGIVTLTTAGATALANDALTDTDYLLGVTANDGTVDSAEATVTISFDGINDAPTIDTATGSTLTENTGVAGDTVATFIASDLDGDTITYSITSGNGNGYFEILDSASGEVTLTAAGATALANDALTDADYLLGVTANDGTVDSAEATVTISFDGINDAPTIDTATGSTLTENTGVAGDTVATFIASDLDGDAVTYSITSGNDNAYFEILDPASGEVTLTAAGATALANDALTDTDYLLGVTANDGTVDSAEATVTISFDGINDAPTIDTATGSTQVENIAVAGDTVATFVASDLDGDAVTYSITSGNADNYFAIDTNTGVVTLTAAGAIGLANDALTDTDYILGVTANDGIADSAEATVTISFDGINDAPTIDTATGSTQVEKIAVAGDTVATFVASDLDGDAVTYSITSGNADNYFAIDTNTGVVTLTAAGAIALANDALTDTDYILGVTANDGIADSAEATVTISFDGINDAPTIDTATGSTQVENIAVAGDTVATFVASDLDGDAVTYSITSGNDNSYFEILDSASGEVTLTAAGETALANDALTDTDYLLGVTANDGTVDSAEATVTISFDGINDVPTIDTATGSTQVENIAVAGDTVATFVASDLDGDAVTYSITSGNDNAYFEILDSASGEVTLTAAGATALANDALTDTDYLLGVTANDGTVDSAEATVTISFDGINDAPTIDTATGSTQVENIAVAGDTVATFVASDLDGDAVTYSITSGNDNAYFEILDSASGEVTLTAAGATALANDALTDTDYLLGVTANDGTVDSAEATVTISFDGINDAPTIDAATGSTQVENIAVAGDAVATFVASDLDGDAVTYSITSGNGNGYFEILDPASGVVTLTAAGATALANDALTDTDYLLGVTANDGTVDSAEATVTISFDGINDAPTIDTATGSTQVENIAVAGDTVATFVASDLDGDAVTYSITSGNADNYFAIDTNTGVVTLTAAGAIALANDALTDTDSAAGATALANDALTDTDYLLGVTANDGTVDSAEATVTISFDGINDAPTIDTATGSTQVENIAVAGDTVATFVASDLDGDAVTYSITSGNGNAYFEILDPASGIVTLTTAGATALANDALTDTDYILGVTANDGTVDSAEATVTISFDGINDVPTIDTATGSTQVENIAVAGDTVATFVASDLDGDAVTYSITSGNGNAYFEILDPASGIVTLTTAGATALANDALTDTDYLLGVTANDGTVDSAEATVTISFDGINDAPTIDTATGSTLTENTGVAGDTVATFIASDLDGDTVTYSITSGNGNGYFDILDPASGVVTLTAAGATALANDALTDTDYLLGVTANDGTVDSAEATVTISFDGINDAPTIDAATGSTQVENIAVAGDAVATFVASDLDGDAVTYSITSGNDNAYFEILDPASGVVTLTAAGATALANDALTDTDYLLGVTANDGTVDSAEATVTISFDGINDVPTIDTATGSTQVENIAVVGDIVATFVASDLDGDAVTYSITSGNGNGYFEILDSASGEVTLTAAGATALANDALTDTDYILGVTANDGTVDSAEATVTISFDGINDAPTIDTATGSTLTENTGVAGDTVATFIASDLDGDTITYSITSGNDNAYFEILDSASGEVTLTAAGATALANDALADADYTLGVTANDGTVNSAEATVTISFDGINDAPTIDTATGSTLTENTAVEGDIVATFVASDLDGDAITYSITSGNADGYFAIDTNTGIVTLTAAGQAAIENDTLNLTSLELGVTANDGSNNSTEAAATILITRANDNAPTVSSNSIAVNEDSVGTNLGLSAPVDADGDALTITVTGLPLLGVVTLANGSLVSDGQLLTADEVTGLLYNAPTSYNGADAVGGFSYTVNDGAFTVVGTVDVAVTPIADAPDLSALGSTSIAGIEGEPIALPEIQAALNDLSGSESLQLELRGIPLAAVISDGVNSFTALTDNAVLDLSGWDVAALTFSGSADGDSSQYTLTVRATSTEATTADTALNELSINVTVFDTEPVAVNDSDEVGYSGTAVGNVISGEGGLNNGADTVAFDGARVSSIAFAGAVTQIAAGATESIVGDSGVLTISSDGSYSYVSTVVAPAPVAVKADGKTAVEWSEEGVDPYGFSSLNDALSSGNLNIASLNSTATGRVVETGKNLGVSGSGSDRINDGEAIVLDLNGVTDEINIEVDKFDSDEQITWNAYAADGRLLATGIRSDGEDKFEIVVDGMAYVALSSNDEFRLEEVSYSARGVEPLPADEEFSYTLTDGEDESSAVLTVSHVSSSVAADDTAVVYESGLATGSSAGVTAIEASGNLLDNDSGVSAATDISSVTFGGVTATASSGVIAIDGTYGSLLVYTEDGVGHRAGDYAYTLNAASSGDAVEESFSYSLSDGTGQPGILNIAIVDDAPVGTTLYESLEASTTVPVFNLVVILDVSGSMRGDRLALAKAALGTMFDEYDRLGDVNIQIVPFSSNADKSSWYLDNLNGAMDYVNALSANGGTDYDAALNTTMANFDAPQGQTVFYFLSDGEPTEGGGITGSEINTWENFVAGEDAVSFGIGIGSGVSLNNLNPIAYPNSSEYALVVENTTELANTLLSTIDSNAISGNISVMSVDGEPGIYVGADGGYISRIEIGGDVYTYSPDSNPADATEITIATPEGASLQVNFITGEYRYSVELDQTIVGRQEAINITATDNDGDSLSVDLVIDLNYQPNLDANRDTVLTNAGGVVEIPVEALLHNDSGNSNVGFDSVAVGASGTVSVSNGVVSFVPAPQQPIGTFTNVVENGADSSANALNNSLLTAEDFSDRSLFGVVNAADAALISDDAIPTARFQGRLNASNDSSRDQDWIRLYLNEGERVILDIDQGGSGNSGTNRVNTVMALRDSNGNQLAYNNDSDTTQGGLGSTSGRDSYIEYTATSEGYYYVSVTSNSQGDSGDYELWMSIDPQPGNFGYTISDGVLSNSASADVSLITGSTVQGSTDDEVLVGGDVADTLIGDGGDDALVGNAGEDVLQGGDGDDLLIGGADEDQLSGGLGADVFSWSLADAASAGAPVVDTIRDFDTAAFTAGGDAINLKDLLIDESGEDLTSYLQFERVDLGNGDFDTVLHVSSTGAFDGGNTNGGIEQSILLQGVDLLGTSTDQQALIQDLIATGKLITD